MYLVLVMQFGSFTAPLPVMMSLPLSLIGVVLALLATRGTLNLMSFIGVIMLMGLVAKNAILLLDCARKEEAQGVSREDALRHAGRVRLRPILMTTFALIAGMPGGSPRQRQFPGHSDRDHRRHITSTIPPRRADL
jgi:HAE1 family hydrophobic/amphiphilic exporter-1